MTNIRNPAFWKAMANNLRSGTSNFTTSTSPKLKAYAAATADSPAPGGLKSKFTKGGFVPVCVAIGMIGLSASFGLYTGWHTLGNCPDVFLKKSRRETVPEVEEPDRVAEQAEKFVKQSFFRKVAHVQDFDRQEVMSNPIRGDVFTRPARVVTLKDVGVDPKPH